MNQLTLFHLLLRRQWKEQEEGKAKKKKARICWGETRTEKKWEVKIVREKYRFSNYCLFFNLWIETFLWCPPPIGSEQSYFCCIYELKFLDTRLIQELNFLSFRHWKSGHITEYSHEVSPKGHAFDTLHFGAIFRSVIELDKTLCMVRRCKS